MLPPTTQVCPWQWMRWRDRCRTATPLSFCWKAGPRRCAQEAPAGGSSGSSTQPRGCRVLHGAGTGAGRAATAAPLPRAPFATTVAGPPRQRRTAQPCRGWLLPGRRPQVSCPCVLLPSSRFRSLCAGPVATPAAACCSLHVCFGAPLLPHPCRRAFETFDSFSSLGASPNTDTYNALMQARAAAGRRWPLHTACPRVALLTSPPRPPPHLPTPAGLHRERAGGHGAASV